MSKQYDSESSFYDLFVPLTNKKAIIFIIIIGFVVFFNMLFNNFIWDDKSYIIQNPDLHVFNISKLFGPNIFNAIGQYRPIPAMYFATLYALFRDNQFFYHFLQLLLHIVNTVLVFTLFTKFFNKGLSFFGSLFFLVHPLQVESVSFISAAISPIFFFFGISAFLLSIKEKQTKKEILFIFFLLLLSFLTKETGILFLLMILLYKIIFHKKSLLPYSFFGFIAGCVYLMMRFFIGGVGLYRLVLIPIVRLSLSERLINIPAIIYYYVNNFFIPVNLSHNQLWVITNLSSSNVYFPLLIDILFFSCIGLTGFGIYKKSRQVFNVYLFFLFWFVLGLGMHLQIIPLDETVADRWMYFPLVGIIGITICLVEAYRLSLAKFRNAIIVIVIGLIVIFSVRTIARNADWIDGVSLYTHDIQISDNFDIEDNLGTEYFAEGNYKQAVQSFTTSYNMFPYEVNAFNTALAYTSLKDYDNAEIFYDKSLVAKDYAQNTHDHELGNYQYYAKFLLQLNQYEKAESILKRGVQDYPNDISLWMLLAYTNNKEGNKDEAVHYVQEALRINPSSRVAKSLYDSILNSSRVIIK